MPSHRQERQSTSLENTRLLTHVHVANVCGLCEVRETAAIRLTGGGVSSRTGAGSSVAVYLILRLSNRYPCLRRSGNLHLILVSIKEL